MKNLLKSVLSATIVGAGLFVLFDLALTGSDVMVSHSTGACVKVVNYDDIFFDAGDYNCENLPPKYNHVWVK